MADYRKIDVSALVMVHGSEVSNWIRVQDGVTSKTSGNCADIAEDYSLENSGIGYTISMSVGK
jgi:hypothetical protein